MPPITSLNKIMGTKKKKNWVSVKVEKDHDYPKAKKMAEVREISVSALISILINK